MQEEALADLGEFADAPPADQCTVCLFRPEWHQGVVGIVASRLKDRFHRPAVVFARGAGGELRGSGRSIGGFHLRDALDLVAKRAPGTITRFGGHAFAAGLTLPEPALPAFREAFEAIAREQLGPDDLDRICATDGNLAPGELTFELARDLRGRVWGQGLPAPTFDDTFDVRSTRIVGGKHSRLVLERDGERFTAILFGQTDPLPAPHPRRLPPGRQRVAGQRVAGTDDRALVARQLIRRAARLGRTSLPLCSKLPARPAPAGTRSGRASSDHNTLNNMIIFT